MTTVILALGSNLGHRVGNLRAAVRILAEKGVAVTARSSVWESAPVPAGQPRFLNAVVTAETSLSPEAVLDAIRATEHELGRRPGRRWGPRPIDVDILYFGDVRCSTPVLTIPHPRIAERPFVLAPLSEVLPVPGIAIDLAGFDLTAFGREVVNRTSDVL